MKRHSYWWLWLAEFPCPVSCPQPHSYLLLNPMHQRPISELLRVITLYTSDLIPGAQPSWMDWGGWGNLPLKMRPSKGLVQPGDLVGMIPHLRRAGRDQGWGRGMGGATEDGQPGAAEDEGPDAAVHIRPPARGWSSRHAW